ncbi:MAG: YihA family ribosome biogenesis GTP-binding protein [Saprospiraceae bacterium]|nr:YihA family ribosome biogenesis GTP-binding protein [Saprospiraceae bacterium]
MEIHHVEYFGSFVKETDCPTDKLPEFAFIGRSNVGKSSLINFLCQRKAVAHVSKEPGKTQTINFFRVDDSWYLVDLPGYGYAKVSKKLRGKWEKMIEHYLVTRQTLMCACVLVDANIPPQEIDVEFMNWLGKKGIPFVIIYTKSDKSKSQEIKRNLTKIRHELLKYWNELPLQFKTSSEKNVGRREVLEFIGGVIEQINQD